MIVRPLFVVAAVVLAVAATGCGAGGSDGAELGAPPVNSAPTLSTAAPTATSGPATTPTTGAPTTAAPTATQAAPTTEATPTTTAAVAPTLTPELEAELIDVYTNARRVLYEALRDPPNADLEAVARYWTPEAVPGWIDLLGEWAAKQLRFEPGPGDRYYAEVSAIDVGDADNVSLVACVVSDAAVFDGLSGSYIDPGYLSSYEHHAHLRLVDGRWLVHSDDVAAEFKDVVGCGA